MSKRKVLGLRVGQSRYFPVGDVVRNARTGEPFVVTGVSLDPPVVFVVRLRWYRRAWFWVAARTWRRR